MCVQKGALELLFKLVVEGSQSSFNQVLGGNVIVTFPSLLHFRHCYISALASPYLAQQYESPAAELRNTICKLRLQYRKVQMKYSIWAALFLSLNANAQFVTIVPATPQEVVNYLGIEFISPVDYVTTANLQSCLSGIAEEHANLNRKLTGLKALSTSPCPGQSEEDKYYHGVQYCTTLQSEAGLAMITLQGIKYWAFNKIHAVSRKTQDQGMACTCDENCKAVAYASNGELITNLYIPSSSGYDNQTLYDPIEVWVSSRQPLKFNVKKNLWR